MNYPRRCKVCNEWLCLDTPVETHFRDKNDIFHAKCWIVRNKNNSDDGSGINENQWIVRKKNNGDDGSGINKNQFSGNRKYLSFQERLKIGNNDDNDDNDDNYKRSRNGTASYHQKRNNEYNNIHFYEDDEDGYKNFEDVFFDDFLS